MNKWSKSEKGLLFAVTLAAAVYVCGLDTKAMHYHGGYLPAGYCIAWGASLPSVSGGGVPSDPETGKESEESIDPAGYVRGVYLRRSHRCKIPSVTGSCSHMTGPGLAPSCLALPQSVSWASSYWSFRRCFWPMEGSPRWEPTLSAWRLQDRFLVSGSISLASGLDGTGRQ